ncbi:hypothetical protein KIPB_007915, partial [Kipferlia bialata]
PIRKRTPEWERLEKEVRVFLGDNDSDRKVNKSCLTYLPVSRLMGVLCRCLCPSQDDAVGVALGRLGVGVGTAAWVGSGRMAAAYVHESVQTALDETEAGVAQQLEAEMQGLGLEVQGSLSSLVVKAREVLGYLCVSGATLLSPSSGDLYNSAMHSCTSIDDTEENPPPYTISALLTPGLTHEDWDEGCIVKARVDCPDSCD